MKKGVFGLCERFEKRLLFAENAQMSAGNPKNASGRRRNIAIHDFIRSPFEKDASPKSVILICFIRSLSSGPKKYIDSIVWGGTRQKKKKVINPLDSPDMYVRTCERDLHAVKMWYFLKLSRPRAGEAYLHAHHEKKGPNLQREIPFECILYPQCQLWSNSSRSFKVEPYRFQLPCFGLSDSILSLQLHSRVTGGRAVNLELTRWRPTSWIDESRFTRGPASLPPSYHRSRRNFQRKTSILNSWPDGQNKNPATP